MREKGASMPMKSVAAPETAQLDRVRSGATALVALMLAAAACYFPWRLGTFNPDALALSWAVYAAEVFGFGALLLHVFMTRRVTTRTPLAPLDAVSVDIFVTTYDEPASMLRRTLAAAKLVRGATRIVLLDDGARPAMRRLAEELNVDYLARAENTHAKAGNLNNALQHSTATFIATFDADHAPAPDFLERTLGYFRYEFVAFVQTPQDFYNLDSFQHRRFGKTNRFWSEQSLFFRVIQPGKDRWNAAFYCGSCAVLRRTALDRIGGFAIGTVTEDIHTSLKLHKAGYQSVYHNQSLAFGVAPASYEPYQTQRLRWGEGAMQVWRKEGVVFTRGLTIAQRLCYLASIVTYFDAWQKALFYLLPPFVLLSGVMPLTQIDWEFAARFGAWYALALLVNEEFGRGYGRAWLAEQYNFLRMPALLRGSASLFFPGARRFRVTRKAGVERNTARKQLTLMMLVPVLTLAAIPLAVARYLAERHLPLDALIVNALWAALIGLVGFTAIRFAWSRTNDRRADYRFVAPLPFDVHLPSGGWGALRAIDMTPDGVRLAAPMGLDFAVGRKLDAVLQLPDGRAHVTLRVRHRRMIANDPLPQRMELGCVMSWADAKDQDRLNALLFGAGLEHKLIGVDEKGPTPLELVERRFRQTPARSFTHAWAPAAIDSDAQNFDIAAQPVNDNFVQWRVFSYQPLPAAGALLLPVRAGRAAGAVRVLDTQTIPAGESTLHLATIELGAEAGLRPAPAKPGEPWLSASVSAFIMGALLVTSASPRAEGEVLALAGGEAGESSSYSYVGAVVPIEENGEGWAARFWGDRSAYSYENDGEDVDGEAYGAEAALAYRWNGEWGYASASAGVRYRDTELSQSDPDNQSEGAHTDVSVATNGRAHMNEDYDLTWNASHEIDQQNTFARAGIDREITPAWRLGLDATRVSGGDYGETKIGVTSETRLNDATSFSARAGASRSDDGDEGGYVGLGLALNLN
jgi:cellulose synthase (UDP-forming)